MAYNPYEKKKYPSSVPNIPTYNAGKTQYPSGFPSSITPKPPTQQKPTYGPVAPAGNQKPVYSQPDTGKSNPNTGVSSYSGSSGYTPSDPYSSILDRMEREAAAERAAREAALQRQYDTGVSEIKGYEADLLRQAEIANRLAMNNLPQQSALMGNGGLSESSLMGLNAELGENRNNINKQALSEIGGLRGKLESGQQANTDAYYNRLNDILGQRLNAQIQQANQAARIGGAVTQTTRANPKPLLTLSQAENAYGNGNQADNVMDTLKYYYGDNYTPMSGAATAFESAMLANLERNPQIAGANKLNGIATAIQSQLQSGRISQNDAILLAQKYGINIQ